MELRRHFDKVNTLLLKHQHPQQCFIYFIYKSFSNQFYDKYKYNIMPISKMSLHNYKTFKAKLFLCWHRTAQRGISFKKNKQFSVCSLLTGLCWIVSEKTEWNVKGSLKFVVKHYVSLTSIVNFLEFVSTFIHASYHVVYSTQEFQSNIRAD